MMHFGAGMASSIPFHPIRWSMRLAVLGLMILISGECYTISRISSDLRF